MPFFQTLLIVVTLGFSSVWGISPPLEEECIAEIWTDRLYLEVLGALIKKSADVKGPDTNTVMKVTERIQEEHVAINYNHSWSLDLPMGSVSSFLDNIETVKKVYYGDPDTVIPDTDWGSNDLGEDDNEEDEDGLLHDGRNDGSGDVILDPDRGSNEQTEQSFEQVRKVKESLEAKGYTREEVEDVLTDADRANEWTRPKVSTNNPADIHWDVQLSSKGKAMLGHLSPSGNHINVTKDGKIHH